MNDIRWCGFENLCPRTTDYYMYIKNGDEDTEIEVEIIKENKEWLDAIRKDTGFHYVINPFVNKLVRCIVIDEN